MARLGKHLLFLVVLLWSCTSQSSQITRDAGPDSDERDGITDVQTTSGNQLQWVEPNHIAGALHQRGGIGFQENDGQWPADVVFRGDSFAGELWVTRDGALVHSLRSSGGAVGRTSDIIAPQFRSPLFEPASSARFGVPSSLLSATDQTWEPFGGAPQPNDRVHRTHGWSLVERFVQGHPNVPRGLDLQRANVSYFIGDDESKWAPHVATFGAVTLGEVWPGIEVRSVTRGHNIEKFFHVAPHRDPSLIEMSIEGGNGFRLSSGALVVSTGNGEVQLSAPVAYQEIGGQRQSVVVGYALTEHGYRFVVGEYDHDLELVIDPILQSTYLGGSGDEFTLGGVTLSPAGDVYVSGFTRSTDFPGTLGGAQTNAPGINGFSDIVICRLNAALTTLLQATYVGGNREDRVSSGVTFGPTGDVYIGGYTGSSDYPATSGGVQPNNPNGDAQLILSRLNSDLTTLIQSTYLGGTGRTITYNRPAIGVAGDLYLSGFTDSLDFPGVAGGAQDAFGGGAVDLIVIRVAQDLRTLLQTTYLGGSNTEWFTAEVESGSGVAVGPAGDVYVNGITQSSDFPGVAGGAQDTYGGDGPSVNGDMFVARLSQDLTTLVQSTYLGGTDGDYPFAPVVVHPSGDIVIGGTAGDGYPGTVGGAQPNHRGAGDNVISRLSGDLRTLIQSTYVGGGNNVENGCGITLCGGDIYSVGVSASSDYPNTSGGALSLPNNIVISRLTADLTDLIQSTYLGGSAFDRSYGPLVCDSSGNLYIAGTTSSPDFPRAAGGAQAALAGTSDLFVTLLTGDLQGCTQNSDCSANDPVCDLNSGLCVSCLVAADCDDSSPCTQDLCASGRCQRSNQPSNFICRNATGPCDAAETCPGGGAQCPPDQFAPRHTPCSNGFCDGANLCLECLGDEDCLAPTPFCNVASNTCVPCTDSSVSCPTGTTCSITSGVCEPEVGCDADSECAAPTPICDTTTRTCYGCGDGRLVCPSDALCDPETGRCGLDPNGDADGDGIINIVECALLTNCIDHDNDGAPDVFDPDDDDDSILTRLECPNPSLCIDTDGDGGVNYLDPDDDGDGIQTIDEVQDAMGVSDLNLDGEPNWLDLDSDGDGSSDQLEGRNPSPIGIPYYLDASYLGGGGLSGGALRCWLSPSQSAPNGPLTYFAFVLIGGLSRRRRTPT